MSDKHLSDLAFSSLNLVEPLARGVADAGFVRCTPIQAQTLPFALAGRDIAGQAQTGTGKTAAFLVAVFQRLLTEPSPPTRGPTSIRAICIAPTRELAVQIFNDAMAEPAWSQAQQAAESADCVLQIGSSRQVYPAADLPSRARRHGATIITVDPHTEHGDISLRGAATELVPKLLELAAR